MPNAFNWEGSPSIFTSGVRQAPFGMGRAQSSFKTSMRQKAMPAVLANSAVHKQPEMQKKGRARNARVTD